MTNMIEGSFNSYHPSEFGVVYRVDGFPFD